MIWNKIREATDQVIDKVVIQEIPVFGPRYVLVLWESGRVTWEPEDE